MRTCGECKWCERSKRRESVRVFCTYRPPAPMWTYHTWALHEVKPGECADNCECFETKQKEADK
jgi:hypothetical protein